MKRRSHRNLSSPETNHRLINNKILDVYRQSLDYGDNWFIASSRGEIALMSHGLNQLLMKVKLGLSLARIFIRLIQYREVAHVLEEVAVGKKKVSLWCCIEPIVNLDGSQLLIVYIQPIGIVKEAKHNQRNKLDKVCIKNVQKLNLDSLDIEERKILEWLKFGFTQQEISEKLLISRSSVVRRITKVCSKLNMQRLDTSNLRQLLNNVSIEV